MNVSFEVEHAKSDQPLLVTVVCANNIQTLDLSQSNKSIVYDFNLPLEHQLVDIRFVCDNISIVNFPLTITNVVLDHFYKSDGILYKGRPEFSQEFLDYANKHQIRLDQTVNDSNRLDFTGHLVYQYQWPFYKNIFA